MKERGEIAASRKVVGESQESLSSVLACDNLLGMATKKTTARKGTKARSRRNAGVSEGLPTPPPEEKAVSLHVEIPSSMNLRLKLVLLHMEASGKKTQKKQFVEQALLSALDEFDSEWGA